MYSPPSHRNRFHHILPESIFLFNDMGHIYDLFSLPGTDVNKTTVPNDTGIMTLACMTDQS